MGGWHQNSTNVLVHGSEAAQTTPAPAGSRRVERHAFEGRRVGKCTSGRIKGVLLLASAEYGYMVVAVYGKVEHGRWAAEGAGRILWHGRAAGRGVSSTCAHNGHWWQLMVPHGQCS